MVTAHSKTKTSKTAGSLIDELDARYSLERLRKDDVTIRQLAEKKGWGRHKAGRTLLDEVAAGRLVEVTVLDETNHEVKAYRKVPITLRSTNRA